MFGSSILEVAIGIVFVYLLLSLICSAVNEIIEAKLKNRAANLHNGITALFGESERGSLVKEFYKHPLIYGLYSGTYERKGEKGILGFAKKPDLPSYIPAGNFAYAVIDIVLDNGKTNSLPVRVDPNDGTDSSTDVSPITSAITIENILSAIPPNLTEDDKFYRAIRTLAQQSEGNINKFRENLEGWFNSSMDRVSGWYTRRTKWIILGLGVVLTIFLNVNTITIAQRLSNDDTLRDTVVAQAERAANNSQPPTANLEENRKQLEKLGLPIGWAGFRFIPTEVGISGIKPWEHILFHLIGWLLTVAAISLGAPFWFDVLNKFMVIRSTVKPHEKSPPESSEDRQKPPKPSSPTLTTETPTAAPAPTVPANLQKKTP